MTFNTLKSLRPLKLTKVNNLLPVYGNTQQFPSDMCFQVCMDGDNLGL